MDGMVMYVPERTAMTQYATLLDILKCKDADVHSLFRCGSRVYGCATESSDDDFLVVLTKPGAKQDLVFRPGINITVHTMESFQTAISNHSIYALECLFSPPEMRLKSGSMFPFKLDRVKLIERATATATSDYRKAKKLFLDEWMPSKKKLYHALRVMLFARQILDRGRIYDFGAANALWTEIRDNESIDWADYPHVLPTL